MTLQLLGFLISESQHWQDYSDTYIIGFVYICQIGTIQNSLAWPLRRDGTHRLWLCICAFGYLHLHRCMAIRTNDGNIELSTIIGKASVQRVCTP